MDKIPEDTTITQMVAKWPKLSKKFRVYLNISKSNAAMAFDLGYLTYEAKSSMTSLLCQYPILTYPLAIEMQY